ncbi:MAG: hypothetical protein AAGA68_10205 [Pseudomonadota bacterium]
MQARHDIRFRSRLLWPLAAALGLSHALPTAAATIGGDAHNAMFDAGSFGHDGGTYTWEELTELIPDLKEGRLEAKPIDEADETGVPMICERRPEIGTRLAKRECYTLEQYVRKECSLGVRTIRVPHWCQAFLPGG